MEDTTKIFIPQELFAPAESLPFDGQLEIKQLNIGPDCYEFIEPVRWSGLISNVGDALLVTGRAQGRAHTYCSRCLEQTTYELSGDMEGYFILKHDGAAPNDFEGDEFDYLSDDNTINMEPIIMAALLIDAPAQPLCSDDCKGLCPVCGVNLNTEIDHAEHELEETLAFSENPFSVLKDYQFGDK